MMSKVSCFKTTANNMKRRIWYGAVLFLAFFFALPLKAMLQFESSAQIDAAFSLAQDRTAQLESVRMEFQKFVGGGDAAFMILVAVAALLGAWSGLCWLHSKKKMDMMGSLPVRRERLFAAEAFTTFFLFFTAYTVNLLLAQLAGAAKGIYTLPILIISLAGWGIHILFFLVFYLCAAAAMLLTGKVLTGILGTGVFLVIAPAVYGIWQLYPDAFWETYVDNGGGMVWMSLLSPVGSALSAVKIRIYQMEYLEDVGSLWLPLGASLILGLIFLALSLWLIKIRPAEGAEQSIAFPKLEGVLKAVLLYPLGLGGGLFFMLLGSIQGGEVKNGFWFWFGICFSLFLGGILIEVIYHLDRKRIFEHKMWTGLGAGAVLLTAIFFAFDLSGYDKWLPGQDEFERAVACVDEYYDNYPDGSVSSVEYLKNHIGELESISGYAVASEGIGNLYKDQTENEDLWTLKVIYQMKNGSCKIRKYRVSEEAVRLAEKEQFEQKVYRESKYPVLLYEPSDVKLEGIEQMGNSDYLESLSQNDKTALISIYQEELSSLSYDEIQEGGNVILSLSWGKRMSWKEYPLNENFVKTVQFLKEQGIELVFWPENLDIQEITFTDYRDSSMEGPIEKSTKDQALIDQAVKSLGGWSQSAAAKEYKLTVTVSYLGTKEDLQFASFYYPKGQVPESVEEFLRAG